MNEPTNRARFLLIVLGAVLVLVAVCWIAGRSPRDPDVDLDAPSSASRPNDAPNRAVARTNLSRDEEVRTADAKHASEATTSRPAKGVRATAPIDRALLSRYCLVGRVEASEGLVGDALVQVFDSAVDGEDERLVGSVRTSAEGSFAVAIVPGSFRVVASSVGKGAGELFVDVDPDDGLVDVGTIRLGSKLCLGGVVRNFGVPIAKQKVTLRRTSQDDSLSTVESTLDENGNARDRADFLRRAIRRLDLSTTTDAEGRYLFAPPETGEYLIDVPSEARLAGMVIVGRQLVERTATTGSMDVDFDLWWTRLSVTFTSALGELGDVSWDLRNPQGAVLLCKAADISRVAHAGTPRTTFETWVPCDEELQIRATAPRHAVAMRTIRPSRANPTLDLAIRLEPNPLLSNVRFRFLGDAESVPPAVVVILEPEGPEPVPSPQNGWPRTTERRRLRTALEVVDREAVWADVEVDPGRYRITLYPGGRSFEASLVLKAGSVDLGNGQSPTVDVACQVGGRLRLEAVDTAAAFVAAECRIIAPDGSEFPASFDLNGRLRGSRVVGSRSRPATTSRLSNQGPDLSVLPLPPGNYVVVFEHKDFETERVSCVVLAGETTEVRAQMRRRAR